MGATNGTGRGRTARPSEGGQTRAWLLADAERLEVRAAELRRMAERPEKVSSMCDDLRWTLWGLYRDVLFATILPLTADERATLRRVAHHLVIYDLGPKGFEVVPLDQRDRYLDRARGFVPALFDWAAVRMPDRTRDHLADMIEQVSLD